MGIRVHKTLGYGLTNVKVKDYRIIDKRFEPGFDLNLTYDVPTSVYIDWLKNRERVETAEFNVDLWMEEEVTTGTMGECISFDPEYGLKNVIALRSPSFIKAWHRYDDTIDWIEESWPLRADPQANHVHALPNGIFPYADTYMDRRTGERLNRDYMWAWLRLNDKVIPASTLDAVAKKLGFSGHEEARKNIRPLVPMEIRELVHFLGIFKSPDTWRELKPLLYVYWS